MALDDFRTDDGNELTRVRTENERLRNQQALIMKRAKLWMIAQITDMNAEQFIQFLVAYDECRR